jgi:hypothetical protein
MEVEEMGMAQSISRKIQKVIKGKDKEREAERELAPPFVAAPLDGTRHSLPLINDITEVDSTETPYHPYPSLLGNPSTQIQPTSVTSFPQGKPARRGRRSFTEEEDNALWKGYHTYGTSWSQIAKDPVLKNRKGTDLRDRFRNRYPDLYEVSP